jgi:transposase
MPVGRVPSQSCRGSGPDRPVTSASELRSQRNGHAGRPRRCRHRVDTHKHTHTLAIVTAATGAVVNQATVAATTAGYQQLLALATQQPGQRIWAIESTGGYGAGLTRFLHASAEQVVELDRPKRAARRHGAKSDPLDATRAAREALGRDHLAQPRATGPRAALSVRLAARRSAVQAAGDAQRQSTPW